MKGFDWLPPKPPWLPTSSSNAASSFLWYIGFIGYNKVDGFAEVFFWARYFCSCSVSSDLPFHEAYDSDYFDFGDGLKIYFLRHNIAIRHVQYI